MNEKDYEAEVKRTADIPPAVFERSKDKDPSQPPAPKLLLCLAAMGLAGETGEVVDYLKKLVFHDTDYDRAKLVKELGDVEWYSTFLRLITGITLEEIRDGNAKKLRSRYPDGFSVQAANDKSRRTASGEQEDDDKTDIVADMARPDAVRQDGDQDTLIEPYQAPPPSFDRAVLQRKADHMRVRKPQLRPGQALWEAAYNLWPTVVETCRGSRTLDPYHNDALIEPFLAELARKLP